MPLDLEIVRAGINRKISKNHNVKWRNYEYNMIAETRNRDMIKSEIKRVEEKVRMEWQDRWEKGQHGGRDTFKFIKSVVGFDAARGWFNPSRLCTYVLTGYGSLNSSLYLLEGLVKQTYGLHVTLR